ncbi:NAD(P)-dependent dehydrogenase (short-subunit alcohol dehydrogenase family) [Arthrobacter pascens]|uniref:SDR family NAD(P)-dependent oxidoreductase n=1 Tax=Arthrobacter pascens TaxID=1677 RepID=UPI0027936355|nr:SDR family oxidoreductase [Arthrobacter pascens]MDQ0678941.1 NAD(P)-dependent dehydrogenase (short-subunit alcohol dehydrogenase family) [Arthrobacter pascens]
MNTNRVVLITGAAGGVGSVLVERFLSNGDTVIATDAREDVLSEWRERWDADAKLFTTAGDVSADEDVARLAEFARTNAGRVDVLINAAGYFPFAMVEDINSALWRQILEINLTGTFLVTQAILPLMKEQGSGRIINYGSGSVFDGVAGQAHYVAAKAGVIGFSRSLAREIGGYGITVNVITPGLTVTQAVRSSFPESILQAQRDARALQRDEVPEDLVGPTFFLASDDSAFISGQILNVDGGAHMY